MIMAETPNKKRLHISDKLPTTNNLPFFLTSNRYVFPSSKNTSTTASCGTSHHLLEGMGINGFGRIGRLVFRAASGNPDAEVVRGSGVRWMKLGLDFYVYIFVYKYTYICIYIYVCVCMYISIFYLFLDLFIYLSIEQIISTKPEGSPPDGGDSGSRNPPNKMPWNENFIWGLPKPCNSGKRLITSLRREHDYGPDGRKFCQTNP